MVSSPVAVGDGGNVDTAVPRAGSTARVIPIKTRSVWAETTVMGLEDTGKARCAGGRMERGGTTACRR